MCEALLPHLYHITPHNPVPEITVPNCSIYALAATEHLLLIDSGNGFSQRSLRDALRSQGWLDGRPITLLLTHCHIDHSGGAEYFHPCMQVCASSGTAAALRTASHRCWYEAPELLRPIPVHTVLHASALQVGPFTVDVVPTPGHTGDSLSFLVQIDDHRCLFSGDLVMPDGSVGWRGSEDYDRQQLLDSLRWLATLDVDVLGTGHGFLRGEACARVKTAWEKEQS